MSRPLIERIRHAIEHHEHEYLWDERVSDPDTWDVEAMAAAEAVLATIYQILDDFERIERERAA